MPVSYTSAQANGIGGPFKFPEDFREACAANVSEAGCRPWRENIHWGGGGKSTQRFENLWDEPYVFAVVVDAKGYWIYRWRPNALTLTVESRLGGQVWSVSQQNGRCRLDLQL